MTILIAIIFTSFFAALYVPSSIALETLLRSAESFAQTLGQWSQPWFRPASF
jgi:hypothetical protein